jgi:hypothetical protein
LQKEQEGTVDELKTKMVRLLAAPRMDEAFLIVLQTPADDPDTKPGMVFGLSGTNTIGRLQTNKIALNHPTVSRDHCVIELRHDGYYVQDRGSANGTIVGGKKITDGQLHRKENLSLGDYKLLFWQGAVTDETLQADLRLLGISPWFVR